MSRGPSKSIISRRRIRFWRGQPSAVRRPAQTANVADRTQITAGGKERVQPKSPASLAMRCGILVMVVYFIRGSLLAWYLHVPEMIWILVTNLALLIIMGSAAAAGGGLRGSWLLVLFMFALGICQAEEPFSSALHWFGLAMLILAVGPVLLNPLAAEVRLAVWRLTVKGLPFFAGLSVLWYVLHLPCPFGRSPFAGFMCQSMLLGPVAGLGIVIASARALHSRSWRWGSLAVLSVIPLLAAGSRTAVLGTGAAGCFLLLRRKPVLGGVLALLFLFSVHGFMSQSDIIGDTSDGPATSALGRKGTQNTREELWRSRIDEFKSSPFVGVGIAMGSGAGTLKGDDGHVRIEPGSSYLAILSMTGGLGFLAFFSALGLLLFQFATVQKNPPLEKDILSVVGIFLAVHGVAEGWVLAFGSPLCFLFWLWLGNVGDVVSQPVRSRAKNPQRTPRRLGSPQPALAQEP